MRFLQRFRARDLFIGWGVYWVALSLQLIPLVTAILRATRSGPGKGEVTASVGDWIVSVVVKLDGRTVYSGAQHMLGLALLIAGPPLAFWLLWVASRPKPVATREPV